MQCAVIGLGEAGRTYAEALRDAGHDVRGYDPQVSGISGVADAADVPAVVDGAEAVLVLTAARFSPGIAAEALPVLAPGVLYLDLTSGSPDQMASVGESADATGAQFVDVAILGPVPLQGASTPLMVSGPGAEASVPLLESIGAPVEVVEGPGGRAMAHKLLRSVLMKGIAAVVCEAVDAGRAAGLEEWTRAQVAAQLSGGEQVVDRFLAGTRKHAVRRADEMRASRAYLDSLGVAHPVTDGTIGLLDAYATPEASHG